MKPNITIKGSTEAVLSAVIVVVGTSALRFGIHFDHHTCEWCTRMYLLAMLAVGVHGCNVTALAVMCLPTIVMNDGLLFPDDAVRTVVSLCMQSYA